MTFLENEVTLLTNYLAAGGKVMCLLGDTSLTDFPNLASVLKVYGIEGADGYIADPTRCYQNQPYYIFPQLNVSGDLANGISSQMVLFDECTWNDIDRSDTRYDNNKCIYGDIGKWIRSNRVRTETGDV